jgi:hypothetical protein
MIRKPAVGLLVLTLVTAFTMTFLSIGWYRGGSKYMVTVTNITSGQIMSPVVVASHRYIQDPLFTLGEPASEDLAKVAEDAATDDLVAALESNPMVKDVQLITGTEGPIMPGESASVIVEANGPFCYVSAVSILVTTNDGFFALNGEPGPRYGSKTYYSPAYDAGSESNNEDCAFIPGPPCDSHFVRDIENAEGYVHVHAGIHGIGSDEVSPQDFDWHNPVARIEIQRTR